MSRRFRILLLLVVPTLIGCDHATKHLAKSRLEGERPVSLVSGVLDLRYSENRGVAFSLFEDLPVGLRTPMVVGFTTLALGAIFLYWRRRASGSLEQLGLALVVAGAVGNLLDRLGRGYVVDFIHFAHWPVFNVADVLILAGGALLVAGTLRTAPTR